MARSTQITKRPRSAANAGIGSGQGNGTGNGKHGRQPLPAPQAGDWRRDPKAKDIAGNASKSQAELTLSHASLERVEQEEVPAGRISPAQEQKLVTLSANAARA